MNTTTNICEVSSSILWHLLLRRTLVLLIIDVVSAHHCLECTSE